MMGHRLKILLLSLIFFSQIWAEVSVEASVDRNTVPLDANVTLTITVSGGRIGGVSAPEFPASDDWMLQGTSSSTSSSIQIINGKFSSSKTLSFIYYISPQRVGNLTIPSMVVNVKGKDYKTKPITINVIKSGVVASNPRMNPSRRGQPSPSTGRKPPVNAKGGKELFISCSAYPETVYVGQQVTVDFSLYTRRDIVNVSFKKDAELKNFWVENLFEAQKLSLQPTTIHGVRYYGMLFRRIAAFPLTPGIATIEPPELTCTVQYRPRSFFDFGRRENVDVSGNKVKVVVKPLPEQGKPASFTGAVGQYSISGKVDRTELPAGEALTFTVAINGFGNIEELTVPDPKLPPDFELFDKKESVSKKAKGSRWSGTKKVDFYLVPRNEGKYVIPPLEFSYFDPKRKKYITIATDSIEVNVLKGKGTAKYGVAGRSGIVAVGGDIQFIKPDAKKISIGAFEMRWGIKWLWFLPLELLLILIAVSYRRRQEHLISNWKKVKASKALKQARKKLDSAKKTKNLHESLGYISDAIFGYIGDKLGTDPGAVIFDDAAIHLEERGVQPEIIEEIKNILDTVDGARFAPSKFKIDVKEMVNKAKDILTEIDRKIG